MRVSVKGGHAEPRAASAEQVSEGAAEEGVLKDAPDVVAIVLLAGDLLLDLRGDRQRVLCSGAKSAGTGTRSRINLQLSASNHIRDPQDQPVSAHADEDAGLVKDRPHLLRLVGCRRLPVARAWSGRLIRGPVGGVTAVINAGERGRVIVLIFVIIAEIGLRLPLAGRHLVSVLIHELAWQDVIALEDPRITSPPTLSRSQAFEGIVPIDAHHPSCSRWVLAFDLGAHVSFV